MNDLPLPQDAELEKCIVSSVLQDAEILADVAIILPTADTFASAGARIVYSACLEMNQDGSPIDLQLMGDHLHRTGKINEVGGFPGLVKLYGANPTRAHAVAYAKRVRELWMLRQLVFIGGDLARDAAEMAGGEPTEILGKYEQQLFKLNESGLELDPQTSSQVSHLVLDQVERLYQGHKAGHAFGFVDIDKIHGGLEPGTLSILAGRPGGGKSKFAANVLTNVAQDGKSVLLFNLEMSNRETGLRIACAIANVDHYRLTHNLLTDEEKNRLNDACIQLGSLPIHWLDKPSLRPLELRSTLRRMKRRHGIELAVVDHILLMQPDAKNHRNRNDEVGEISRMVKLAAKESGVAILGLTQMNRAIEGRGDDPPRLSDLRDSGNIEQDADSVMFLHRKPHGEGEPRPTTVDIYIAKQRNGPQGKATLFDRENCFRFENFHRGFPQ